MAAMRATNRRECDWLVLLSMCVRVALRNIFRVRQLVVARFECGAYASVWRGLTDNCVVWLSNRT